MTRWYVLGLLRLLALATWLPAGARAEPPTAPGDPWGIELFEKKIRPVLVEHCFACHSAQAQHNKKLKGGLRLDSRDHLLQGGDSGPAVAPGKAEQSLLIQALRYHGDLRMPPGHRLPDGTIADFVTWVNLGAPDPRGGAGATGPKTKPAANADRFWAYELPCKQPPPSCKDAAWPESAIDRFILAGLEAKGLRPVADADRPTLARRVYYDLIGLPPSPEETEAFVNDRSPDAYEKLVERLLASPQFGERWGRHWLDVARFGESLTLRGFVLKEAWRYRDYVIEAFNQDMPFDQFLREQVAGDLLPAPTRADRRRQLVATTFLTLGNTNLEEQDKQQLRMDVVDEQLEAIGKGLLAQTVGCARCHDHKFDPIPTRDYYALAGILRNTKTLEHANVSRWLDVPLPVEPEQDAVLKKHEDAVAGLQARVKALHGQSAARVAATSRGPRVIAVQDLPGVVVDDARAKKVGVWKDSRASGQYVGRGYVHDLNAGKGEKTLTFQPDLPHAGKYEVRLAYSAASNRAARVPVTILSADGETTLHINQQETPPIDGLFLSLGQYRFEQNNQGYLILSNEGTQGYVVADAVLFIPVEPLAGPPGPARAGAKQTTAESETFQKLEAELKRLQANGPKRPLVMSVLEEPAIDDTHVHIRGSVHNLGQRVPRGFLSVATHGKPPAIPANESGRRQLGEWLTSKDNPLTARVIVNRTWHWLFGAGIVRTTDNFGTTGEMPSHPALLDALAVQFVEDGWSVKKLVRRIVLSHTYRLAATDQPEGLAVDPENRLLWRGHRRRLDAECLRDTILSVSGQLSRKRGGPTYRPNLATDYDYQHADTRRSVYTPVFRNALPELFEVFDFADPSVATGRRNVSTAAPQALFLMNHPFVVEQARRAARRLLDGGERDEDERVTRAYLLTLGRPPTSAERRIAIQFLHDAETTAEEAWAILYQALFASVEFRYVN